MPSRSIEPEAPSGCGPALSRRAWLAAGAGLMASAGQVGAAGAQGASAEKLMLAEMSWLDLRNAVASGFDSVVVPSGGLEQNGLHMIIDKHQHIVRHTALEIARRAGRMLMAPVIAFVPEGGFAPPTGNMRFPGTIGVSEDIFEGLLRDVGRSLRNAGFRNVYFIADHGQSQAPQARAVARLNAEAGRSGVRYLAVDAYYTAGDQQMAWLKGQGETTASIGDHAGLLDTSELLATYPQGVRLAALTASQGLVPETGASGSPDKARADWGQALLEIKIAAALTAIASHRAQPAKP